MLAPTVTLPTIVSPLVVATVAWIAPAVFVALRLRPLLDWTLLTAMSAAMLAAPGTVVGSVRPVAFVPPASTAL